MISRYFDMRKFFVVLVVIGAILGEIFLTTHYTDTVLALIIILYLLAGKKFNLSSKDTFIISLCIVLIMFVSLLLKGTSGQTERSAAWLFFFLTIGIIQKIRE